MGELERHPGASARIAAGRSAMRPTELDGGITNRNFRVTLGGEEYVVQAARQGHRAARDRPRSGAARDRSGCAARDRAGRRGCVRGLPGDELHRLRAARARAKSRRTPSSSRARCARSTTSGAASAEQLSRARAARGLRGGRRAERGGDAAGGVRRRPSRCAAEIDAALGRSRRRGPATTTCSPATSSSPPRIGA